MTPQPGASRLLDIGCGICSVGLSALYKCRAGATLVGIEAQVSRHTKVNI